MWLTWYQQEISVGSDHLRSTKEQIKNMFGYPKGYMEIEEMRCNIKIAVAINLTREN